MIKVGIIGAEKIEAGELLRILLHHPEVDIVSLYSPAFAGRRVASCHHGFLGEEIVNFTEKIDPSELDIIFIADDSPMAKSILTHSEDFPKLRIVDMSESRFADWRAFGLEYGLSEINRKSLVRGARLALVPSAPAALTLLALHPLALHLLLSSDVEISVAAPQPVLKALDADRSASEIATMLSKVQTSFNGKVRVSFLPVNSGRSMRVRILMRCPLSIAEVDKVFESVYDDHSFVFTSLSNVDRKEVEGTHKCMVTFSKPAPDTLELESVGDAHLRGGAGDAVHVLNLFFALDEKVGLHLKPSLFGAEDDGPQQVSWFA